jgi:hypothetical protein
MLTFAVESSYPNFFVTLVIFKNAHVNNRPLVENSPNLVTLSEEHIIRIKFIRLCIGLLNTMMGRFDKARF